MTSSLPSTQVANNLPVYQKFLTSLVFSEYIIWGFKKTSEYAWLSNCLIFSHLISKILSSHYINYPARSEWVLSSPLQQPCKSPWEAGAWLGNWHPGSWCWFLIMSAASLWDTLSTMPSSSGPDGLHTAMWVREVLEKGQQVCVWCGPCWVWGLKKWGPGEEMYLLQTFFSPPTSIYSLRIIVQSHLQNLLHLFVCCR